jgi:hypothetical protein
MSTGEKKSALMTWYEGLQSTGIETVKSKALAAGHAVRSGGESILVGAALAAGHVELKDGLDVKVPMGTGRADLVMPIDGWTAALGIAGSVALSDNEVGTDLRNAGNSALSIFTFRKTFAFLSAKKRAAGGAPGGSFAGEGEETAQQQAVDPVVAVARRMV